MGLRSKQAEEKEREKDNEERIWEEVCVYMKISLEQYAKYNCNAAQRQPNSSQTQTQIQKNILMN